MKNLEQIKIFTEVLIGLSWLALVFAIYGYFGTDLFLASTQWMLVSIVLVANAIFFTVGLRK